MGKVAAELGPVEIVVNNAGITRDGVLHRMTFEQWNDVIATNLTSCFNMRRNVIDGMRERGFGRIVNIGSINGQAGQYGQVNYAAAKSGIHGFTKALAQEGAAKGITVNAIAPGYIDTDMVRAVPANVLEKIIAKIRSDVSARRRKSRAACCSLVSDEGGFITGSTLSINGGQHMYHSPFSEAKARGVPLAFRAKQEKPAEFQARRKMEGISWASKRWRNTASGKSRRPPLSRQGPIRPWPSGCRGWSPASATLRTG